MMKNRHIFFIFFFILFISFPFTLKAQEEEVTIKNCFQFLQGDVREIASDGELLYIVNDTGTIYKVDPSTGNILQYSSPSIANWNSANWILIFDGENLWTLEREFFENYKFIKIDKEKLTIIENFYSNLDNDLWIYNGMYIDGNFWFVSSDKLYQVDATNLSLERTIDNSIFFQGGLALIENYMWYYYTGTLYQFDLNTELVVDTIDFPVTLQSRSIVWDGEYFWGYRRSTQEICQVDVAEINGTDDSGGDDSGGDDSGADDSGADDSNDSENDSSGSSTTTSSGDGGGGGCFINSLKL